MFVCVWSQFEPLDRVAVDIPFLLMTDVLSSSPWPLVLASSSLQLLTMTSNTARLQSQLQEGRQPASAEPVAVVRRDDTSGTIRF